MNRERWKHKVLQVHEGCSLPHSKKLPQKTFTCNFFFQFLISFSWLFMRQQLEHRHAILGVSFQVCTQLVVGKAQNGSITWITRIGRPVSFASCSRIWRVGFGVCEKAVFSISNCFAFIVVRGPLRFDPEFPSSGDLFSVCESRVSGSPSREPEDTQKVRARRGLAFPHLPWSSESSCPVLLSQFRSGAITSPVRELLLVSGVVEPCWWCELLLISSSSSSSDAEHTSDSGKRQCRAKKWKCISRTVYGSS